MDKQGEGSNRLVVAAIDFGTTFSGVAFSFKHEFKENPRKIHARQWIGGATTTMKGPTSVLITGDGKSVDSFGYDAEIKYEDLASEGKHKEWFFFSKFKMSLHGEKTIDHDLKIKDATGKEMSALEVFSLSIKFLKDYPRQKADNQTLNSVSDNDIHWVLTVPAIWNDTAKQFMRKAAEMAGIDGKRLTIALEPEAASLYCRHIPVDNTTDEEKQLVSPFKCGTKYLVLDAGGGTVDITVHETTFTGDIKEIHHATGGAWGGTKVDEAFEELLKDLFGEKLIENRKREQPGEYLDLCLDFEIKKRNLTSGDKVTIKIPWSLLNNPDGLDIPAQYSNKVKLIAGKFRFDVDIIKDLFVPTVDKIIGHLKDLMREPDIRGCTSIVMVGGFSECQMLQEKVRQAFPSMKVIIPEDTALAVLKGAVIYGHNPQAINERVCKYTYGEKSTHKKGGNKCNHRRGKTYIDKNGDERCADIFTIHVKKGQAIKLGEMQQGKHSRPISDTQYKIDKEIYASTEPHADFVTDDSCFRIGELKVPVTGGRKGGLETAFMFGGTEIEVICKDKLTKRETTCRVEFLG